MTADDINQAFESLWADLIDSEDFPAKRPLLAHYTSLGTLEKILQTEELWFSNPLVMNDREEVRFGVLRGNELFHGNNSIVKACGSPERYSKLREEYVACFRQFEDNHAIDTYVFCLSEHHPNDMDGLLSMWRGYGDNGSGAAIVFDTDKLVGQESSPLIIARIHYASTEKRTQWLETLMERFATLLRDTNVPDDQLHVPAHYLFERIKLFALFSKHDGFSEEQEWRVVYSPDRDKEQRLAQMFHYSLGPRGAEPRLRFKIAQLDGASDTELSLTKLVNRIILGPCISSNLAQQAVTRMLKRAGKSEMSGIVQASSIPFRPA